MRPPGPPKGIPVKIIYVTASLPYGVREAFVVAEIDELTRMGHRIFLAPRSRKGRVVHAAGLVGLAQAESLFSLRVLRCAARLAFTEPGRTLNACRLLFRSRSIGLWFKNLAVVPKALWLAGLARRWQADHIHCHWAGTTATMALLASKLTGIPWSFTAHRWDVVENNLLAVKTKSASFVRFISHDGLLMATAMGIPLGGNIRVLPMGVKIPDRAQWNPPQPAVVLCPANLLEIKGHRFLIEAWRILTDRGVRGELWLAGDGELRKPLEALVRNLGLSDSIRFLGVVPHDALLKLYETNAVSSVALASIDMGNGSREGIPVALMEAMTYGIPVVATKTGGIPELVLPGTGLLVPPADPAALADALQSVLQDSRKWEQLGRSARKHATEAHDIRRIAFALESAFACASRNAGSSDRPRLNTAVELGIRL